MRGRGNITGICLSRAKGTAKVNRGKGVLEAGVGLKGDAHANGGHRQLSLLSAESVEAFRARGAEVEDGAFGENILISGIDPAKLSVGTVLRLGDARVKLTQKGKECHSRCAIYERMGDCIMPREGVFAEVLRGGEITVGDEVYVEESL